MKFTSFDALEFARFGHRRQISRSGEPYFEHIYRVVGNARRLLAELPEGAISEDEADQILVVAALHDVAEDEDETGVGHAVLRALPIQDLAIRRIRRLDNRFKVGTYMENMTAIADERDIGVIISKLADVQDNSSPERIAQLSEEDRGIARRYERAKKILQGAYDAYVAEHTPA
jgi:(p)ppGpp synthase/HD superfamily hydrolase